MNEPRRHHYLPQCYLRGFCIHPKKRQLFVVDAKQQTSFTTNISNIAQERDFNRIAIEGIDPNFIEKEISKFESDVSIAINNIVKNGAFIKDTKDLILNLIALLAIRSPQRREQFTGFHSDVVDRILDVSLATEDRWNQSQSKHPKEKQVSYKEAKEFYESKKFKISLTNEYLIETEFKLANAILPYLHARNWQLVTTCGNDNIFITSDNPVKLAWDQLDSIPPFFRESPGFGLPNTTVYFPLTKNHFLVGRFDKPSGYLEGSHALVCASNGQTIGYAHSQIFAPSSNARVFSENGKTMRVGDIFKAP